MCHFKIAVLLAMSAIVTVYCTQLASTNECAKVIAARKNCKYGTHPNPKRGFKDGKVDSCWNVKQQCKCNRVGRPQDPKKGKCQLKKSEKQKRKDLFLECRNKFEICQKQCHGMFKDQKTCEKNLERFRAFHASLVI